MTPPTRPTLAVWKFASCDGCQLTLLDCEDELLAVAARLDIAYFAEATSTIRDGPYDLSLVEGSITTPEDVERIQQVRRDSRFLVTIGACATAGGIQALRNFGDVGELMRIVYATPSFLSTLDTSTPISAHVDVDFELRGCPIDRRQLLEVIGAYLTGRAPVVGAHSVCVECKLGNNTCVMVAHGTPCLGPVTHAGCGALCPRFHRGCYGCFGPMETPNTASMVDGLHAAGMPNDQIGRVFHTFNAWSEPFREVAVDGPGEEHPMTHRATGSRVLETGALTRVEGEGAMRVEIRGDRVHDVQLNIYEPPRFFEGFLRGRDYTEPPDITARICGICPVAYQMSACRAIEAAVGVDVGGPLRQLRRLLYCGEWIESHTLHIHFLHAPDFLGYPSTIELAADHRAEVERGLELKKIGNLVLETIGGRAIHPVNVKVGGFYRVPTRRELAPLRDQLDRGRELAEAVVSWVAGFDFPDTDMPYELVSLQHPTEYAVLDGRVVSDRGLDIAEDTFLDHVAEHQVPHSTALHARLLEAGEYLVGPLARFTLDRDRLSPAAAHAADAAGLGAACRNPFRSIVVRAVEVLHACEIAIEIIDGYEEPDRPAVSCPPRAGVGHGVTEAPRGLLYHRYELDQAGSISDAVIVPPTSQNQATIEHDLWHYVENHLDLDDDELRQRAEVTIRNHDPCISCATHFLDLTVVRS